MGDRSTTGYPIPQGREWFKNQLGGLRAGITEVARGLRELGVTVQRSSRQGSAAQRDGLLGVPGAVVADQVALANRKVIWWNTDMGWAESYYAPATAPGLTVPGLMPDVDAGWYPVGRGPWAVSHPVAAQIISALAPVGMWAAGERRYSTPSAASLFAWLSNGSVRPVIPGVYDVSVRMSIASGSGQGLINLRKYGAAGATDVLQTLEGGLVILGSYATTYHGRWERTTLFNDQAIVVWNQAGSFQVHSHGNPRSEFLIEYVGPALETA